MFECIETVYELPLLPNNTASEILLHISGAVAKRWLGEYATMDKMFYIPAT